MRRSQDYVLVLDEQQRKLHQSDFPLVSTQYSLVLAASAEHAVEHARQAAPCLVILVGDDQAWFKDQVRALRYSTDAPTMTIVALTDSTAPRWQASPDLLELDGFLVKPLTDDILTSLVQSAIVKRCYQ
jgi:AmiR/NasT family two-component response regulator